MTAFMKLGILRNIWFFLNVAISVVGSVAVLMLIRHFVSNLLGREAATVFVVVVALLVIPALIYGLYGAILVQFYGVSLTSRMDRISRFIPARPKVWFLLLTPLLLTLFVYVYQLFLTLLAWLALLPSGGFPEGTVILHSVILAISVFLALSTVFWMWKRIKGQNKETVDSA